MVQKRLSSPTDKQIKLIIHKVDDKIIIEDLKVSSVRRRTTAKKEEPVSAAWDAAYNEYFERNKKSQVVSFIEPDITSRYIKPIPKKTFLRRGVATNDYLKNWPKPNSGQTEFIWHLDDEHSQLRKAAVSVVEKYRDKWSIFQNPQLKIKIGHIDTGYLDHLSTPQFLNKEAGTSFVKKDKVKNGKDVLDTGFPGEQDGHGCATLAILAGNNIGKNDAYGGYQGYFGAIPFAEIIPVRICDTVYNFFNANDVADGIDYAVDKGCEVITMSMAGYPTRRVAKAVNRAYEKGVVLVTAAGNNWSRGVKKLTPKAIMYPARFKRVIAATGACCNHKPYDLGSNRIAMLRTEGGEFMQGNWGPDSAMDTAVAAYTPNLPWATTSQKEFQFYRTGGGTSSATPQVAATVALWILYNRDELKNIEGSWKKVEAARRAIFKSANKDYADHKKYYGNGIIRAFDALTGFDFSRELDTLTPTDEARVSFGGLFQFANQWFRKRDSPGTTRSSLKEDDNLIEMLSLEIIQLLYRDENLYQYTDLISYENPADTFFVQDQKKRNEFIRIIKQSQHASNFLKSVLTEK